jgi:serine/threonine protein kinase
MLGTPLFMAPEVMTELSDEHDDASAASVGYGRKADVWSLGILTAEILDRGQLPWPKFVGAGHAMMHISSDAGVPIVPVGISDAAAAFVRRCTTRDPALRPTAVELLGDPWLADGASSPLFPDAREATPVAGSVPSATQHIDPMADVALAAVGEAAEGDAVDAYSASECATDEDGGAVAARLSH